ncbi:hypothetical protein Celaphus_00011109, partial [Cervus elaphus hippelaphus]
FLKLHHLQDLYLDSPSFLEGCLDQMLRCLRTPLDHLAITNCQLTESDLTYLSQCPNICQLKGLDLSGVTMTDFSPEILHILLEQVAATLQELNLEQCGITESQLESILPVLSCCSQLRTFSLCGNVLSMAIMEKLLSHTTGLINLSDEFYPAPQESYSPHGALHLGRMAQLRDKLIDIMRDLGQLPMEFIPPLFIDAFYGRHIETLKAMEEAWPFVCLPLGILIDLHNVGPLQAVLEALDVLLAQKAHSSISQLKVLDLSGVTMTDFSLEIFPVLLEKASTTLQKLDSDLCGIRDSQCEALLPALSCCSQLMSFSLSGNFLSMAIMEKMLQLSKSQVVSYPSGEDQSSDSFWSRVRMHLWIPPRLLDLVAMSLLRDEASVITTLEYLPIELFPSQLMGAFYGRHSQTLKPMRHTWPYVLLPL